MFILDILAVHYHFCTNTLAHISTYCVTYVSSIGWPFIAVMHDSGIGIGIDSGMIPLLLGTGIGIGIKRFRRFFLEFCWNRNRNWNQAFWGSLESESELESNISGIVHHCFIACGCVVAADVTSRGVSRRLQKVTLYYLRPSWIQILGFFPRKIYFIRILTIQCHSFQTRCKIAAWIKLDI